MPSRSVSSAKVSGLHLNTRRGGTLARPIIANILSSTLKQSSSSHCTFSVARGSERHNSRTESKFIAKWAQLAKISNLFPCFPEGYVHIHFAFAAIDGELNCISGAMVVHDLRKLLLVLYI